jgi:hypothetical protein
MPVSQDQFGGSVSLSITKRSCGRLAAASSSAIWRWIGTLAQHLDDDMGRNAQLD